MARRLGGQGAGQVLAHHEPGHADVAAEELVLDRDHAHVVAAAATSGAEHPGAVGAGEDADGASAGGAGATATAPRAVAGPSVADGAVALGRGAEVAGRLVAVARPVSAPSTQAKNRPPAGAPVAVDAVARRGANSSSKVRAMPTPSSCIGKPS